MISNSSPLEFRYSGIIRGVAQIDGAENPFGFQAGQRVYGSFVVDPTAQDTDPSLDKISLPYAISRFSFDVVNGFADDSSYSSFYIDADPSFDQVSGYLNVLYPGVSDVFSFGLSGSDPDQILGNGPIDLTQLSLSEFDLSNCEFAYQRAWYIPGEQTQVLWVNAKMDSLTVTALPDAGSSACMLLMACSLFLWRKM